LPAACGYAVLAVVLLARREDGTYVPSHQLARATGIGRKYLLKLTEPLARAGVLQSWNARAGGYRLARSAQDISLLEVVEAIDGPVRGRVPQPTTGADAGIDRRLRTVRAAAAEVVRKRLGRVSVADLAEDATGDRH
jgi:Rrf2 family protein